LLLFLNYVVTNCFRPFYALLKRRD